MVGHEAIRFAHVHFDNNWNRVVDSEKARYNPVGASEKVYVLRETPLSTFTFDVPHGQEVWISWYENLAFLPVKHTRKDAGDTLP